MLSRIRIQGLFENFTNDCELLLSYVDILLLIFRRKMSVRMRLTSSSCYQRDHVTFEEERGRASAHVEDVPEYPTRPRTFSPAPSPP